MLRCNSPYLHFHRYVFVYTSYVISQGTETSLKVRLRKQMANEKLVAEENCHVRFKIQSAVKVQLWF